MAKNKYNTGSGIDWDSIAKQVQAEFPDEEPKVEPKGEGKINYQSTLGALESPGQLFNKGMSQLKDNPLTGLQNIGQGLIGVPFLMASLPIGAVEDVLKTTDRMSGQINEKGQATGIGNDLAGGLSNVFNVFGNAFEWGRFIVDEGIKAVGLDPKEIDNEIKNTLMARYPTLAPNTPEEWAEFQQVTNETGKLASTLIGFKGVHQTMPKKTKPIEVREDIPTIEPKEVKQLESPKGSFSKIEVDQTGRATTVPKTENTQAYTKLELLRDELAQEKTKLVSDVENLKKRSLDKNLTKEQRVESVSKLKETRKQLNEVSEKLPLVEEELKTKRFEVEQKAIPEQKLLTEGQKEPIPTENAPSNINFTLPKEKKIEVGKEEGLKGLPVEKAVDPKLDLLRKEALEESISRQSLNTGFNPLDYKKSIQLGLYHVKNGVQNFAEWSKAMIKDLGEKIKPYLLRIWDETKKFGKDLAETGFEKLNDLVEKQYGSTKIVDTKLFEKSKIDPKKSFGEGMRTIAQKDRETIKQEYREVIKEKEKLSTKVQNTIKEVTDVKKIAKTVFEPITTSAEKVSKDVFRRFRLYGKSYQTNLLKRHEAVGEFFDKKSKSKMDADVSADFNISLLNGWFDDAKKIAKKHGFEKELDNVLKMKDELAKELGVKTIENHFPRMVEDFDGFVKFLEEKFPDYYKDNFSRMIVEKASKVGRELTVEEKANLINNSLRGYNPGITLSDKGNMKKRIIETLDGELAKFYHNPDVSLIKYINEMTELAEARKFFGKGYDVMESIGAYIQELRDGKKIDLDGSRELMEIFKARFGQKPITNKGITALRDIGVVTKLGNPYSTMTQLKDLAYSIYFSPARAPIEFAKMLGSKITGKTPEWQIKELGIDPLKIAEELANPKKRAKIVQGFLDYSGFSKLDMIGKETLINTLWQKYQKQSKDLKLNAEFERRIERYFGKGFEKTKVLSDLRQGKKTDSTAFLLYNELVGAQPISLIEMPRGYLKGGNWRIAYFLKTFTIRQLDFALNETVRVMRDKSLPKEQRVQGFGNLIKLGTSLALVGASVDQIRGYLMSAITGKKYKPSFGEDVLDNLLNVALLSKFDYTKARQNGLDEALGSKVLPPMDFISDPLIYDLPNILSEKGKALRSTKHVPLIGKFLYEYLNKKKGGGSINFNLPTNLPGLN